MTKERRTEIILDHLKCLLRYFTFDDSVSEYIQKEICTGCPERLRCERVWQKWLKREIKSTLDYEFKLRVDARVCILTGEFKGQGGIITAVGAKHNNNGVYCFVKIANDEEITMIYPGEIEILK